jgi:hypothetical protein
MPLESKRRQNKVNVYLPSLRMKVLDHVYVFGHSCNMYKSDLRHIHDPVLSSLKMEGICFLYMGMLLYTVPQTNKITHIILHAPVTIFYSLYTKSMFILLTDNIEIKIKEVKGKESTLEQATKAHRGSRGIAMLFL